MNILERLAAWYLNGKVQGFVLDQKGSIGSNELLFDRNTRGWIYGNNWHINFPLIHQE